jgi:hypothetical protein
MRKQNFSIYDISETVKAESHSLSPVAVSLILKEEGFARLPRRYDDERPDTPQPTVAAVADVRRLDLRPRQLRTKFGGLFLFVPYLGIFAIWSRSPSTSSLTRPASLARAKFPRASHACSIGLKTLWQCAS